MNVKLATTAVPAVPPSPPVPPPTPQSLFTKFSRSNDCDDDLLCISPRVFTQSVALDSQYAPLRYFMCLKAPPTEANATTLETYLSTCFVGGAPSNAMGGASLWPIW